MQDEKNRIGRKINEKSEELISLADRIWEAAELKFGEYRSSACQCDYLRKQGFDVEENLAGIPTAFRASYGENNPVVGILGEYDALAMLNQKGNCAVRQEATTGGNGHGCGHNLLGVASIGAALSLKELISEGKVRGKVIYYGCPGEEGGSGKAFMARTGLFDDLDVAFCWHPGSANFVRSASSLANIQARFQFTGKASHAAGSPHLGRSALDAVELMNVGVNFLREHVPVDTRMHYAITNSGGVSPNVVQPYAEVLYLVRSPKFINVPEIYDRICNVAKGATLMTDTTLNIVFEKACSELVMNDVLGCALHRNFEEVGAYQPTADDIQFAEEIRKTLGPDELENGLTSVARESCNPIDSPAIAALKNQAIHRSVLPFYEAMGISPGSTDVGDCSKVVPTAQINTATFALGTLGHSWQMTSQSVSNLAHQNMFTAAKVMAMTGYDVLTDPELLNNAKEEFKKRMEHKPYVCPIPKDIKPFILERDF